VKRTHLLIPPEVNLENHALDGAVMGWQSQLTPGLVVATVKSNGTWHLSLLKELDWSWITWQGFVPLAAPLIIWFGVCLAKSTLQNAPPFAAYLKTLGSAVEEYGWLTYAVFVSLQAGSAINAAKSRPTWLFGLNLFMLIASVAMLAIAFVARFVENNGRVTMKAASDVQIQRGSAGLVAVGAAIVGYLAMSSGRVL